MKENAEPFEAFSQAINSRTSVRAFDPAPLDKHTIEALFAAAQRAPSWCNVQPWRAVVTAPPVTQVVSAALLEAAESAPPSPDIAFPVEYPEPYAQHRRSCGFALYGAMGVAREDREARHQAWLRNYQLFDAPHLVVVSRDRRLGEYATLDVGIWLGYLFTGAALLGVDCCALASLAAYSGVLRSQLAISEQEMVLFGLVLGRKAAEAPANQCRTTREPIEKNLRFLGF